MKVYGGSVAHALDALILVRIGVIFLKPEINVGSARKLTMASISCNIAK